MEDYEPPAAAGTGVSSVAPQRRASLVEVGALSSSPEAPTHAAPLPAVPPPPHPAPLPVLSSQTRECGVCGLPRPREAYSNTQWRKMGNYVRCKQCSGTL
jgi:hypothetical protein